jgi:hypothetical protein
LALLCATLAWQEAEQKRVEEFNNLLAAASNNQVKDPDQTPKNLDPTGLGSLTWILGPSYIQFFLKYIILKIEVSHRFSEICRNLAPNYLEISSGSMVPEKFVVVRVKTSPQTLAAPRLVLRYATMKILIEIQVVAKSTRSEDPVFTSMGAQHIALPY